MAGFDEQLNQLLSNPAAMAQIAQLAQSLTAASPPAAAPPPSSAPLSPPSPPPPSSGAPPAPAPQLPVEVSEGLVKLLPLIQELGGKRDSNARRLLYALQPYLPPRRQENLDRALRLARLYCAGKKFLSDWEG